MELLREIAFLGRTKERKASDLKVGDLTTFGRITNIVEDGRVLVFKFHNRECWPGNLAVPKDDKIEVII